jgi:thiamine pyrophosphokinase
MKEIDAVILANGDYPTNPIPLQVLAKAPFVVCCDGAANEHIARGFTPDVIIGDGDSLSEENKLRFAHIMKRVPCQETNDQTKAVRYLLEHGKRSIAILGATGKREDHTLGNISLLVEYMRMGADVRIYTDHGVFIPCKGTCSFDCQPGQNVSIFNISAHGMKSTGLQYPIYDFTALWQGTLNKCASHQFTIEAVGEYLVFVAWS